jgi:outer membrane protein assembly factor BamB
MMRQVLVSVLLVALGATAAAAEPAPAMFRGGSTHAGVFPGPPADRLSVVWSQKTGGAIVSSPTVSQDTVYIGSGDGFLYALARADGSVRWKAKTGGAVDGSPAVAHGLVYVTSRDGALHAFDTASGVERWSRATDGERRYTKPGVLGMQPATEVMPDPWDFYLSSPAVSGDLVVFGSGDGKVYALDAQTGAVRWSFATGDVVHASPAISGGIVYIGSWDGRFYALDAGTGRKLWDFATGRDDKIHLMTGIPGSAAVAGGRVFFGSRDAHVYALDAKSGALLWTHATDNAWVEASPAVTDDAVYVPTSDSEKFLALDPATGRPLFQLPTHIYGFSSPAVAGGHAYFGTFDGQLHDVDLKRRAYAASFATPGFTANGPRWLNADGRLRLEQVWTGPSLDDAVVGIRERLFSLGAILSSPAVADGVVYVGSTDGTVYALR